MTLTHTLVLVRHTRMSYHRMWELQHTVVIKPQQYLCLVLTLTHLSSRLHWTKARCPQSSFRAEQKGQIATSMISMRRLRRTVCSTIHLVQESWNSSQLSSSQHSNRDSICSLSNNTTSNQWEETISKIVKILRLWAEILEFRYAFSTLNLAIIIQRTFACMRVKIPAWSLISLDRSSTCLTTPWENYTSRLCSKFRSTREDKMVNSRCLWTTWIIDDRFIWIQIFDEINVDWVLQMKHFVNYCL